MPINSSMNYSASNHLPQLHNRPDPDPIGPACLPRAWVAHVVAHDPRSLLALFCLLRITLELHNASVPFGFTFPARGLLLLHPPCTARPVFRLAPPLVSPDLYGLVLQLHRHTLSLARPPPVRWAGGLYVPTGGGESDHSPDTGDEGPGRQPERARVVPAGRRPPAVPTRFARSFQGVVGLVHVVRHAHQLGQ